MRKLRNILSILLIAIILAVSTTSQAAKVEVTKEKIEEAFKLFQESGTNEENGKIEVTDSGIKISTDEYEYEIKYDLTDKPTFTAEALIKDGMSYEEFQEETGILIMPMLGHMAVANIQGAELEDSVAYIMMYVFQMALGSLGDSSSTYIIYDDTNTTDNMIPEANENQKVIKQSEFDKYVMEFVNSAYKDTITLKDSEGINSFEWTIKQEDVTDSSCKLVSTMSIDLDADFSQIAKLVEEMGDSMEGSMENLFDVDISDTNSTSNEVSDETNETKNTTTNINTIPKAGTEFGVKNILQIVIFVSILSIVIILITGKKEKN